MRQEILPIERKPKILLIAINAKYIHSNLAVHSLKAYAQEYQDFIEIAEYTINHRVSYLLQEIYKQKPDILCFSCYIWNLRQVQELIVDLHKLLPQVPIWVGGPEVSYEPEQFLREYPMVTGVMLGEGEASFRHLCAHYLHKIEAGALPQIPGLLFYRAEEGFVRTPPRPPLPMDDLPFCYASLEAFENRIIYYETSRGCPFSCSYCLSSIEKGLRFRSLSLVREELQFFLDHRVPQVKFVDRTFNCSHGHAMAVWQYIKDHDNGVTNFHFEISADLLTEEELALLSSLRPGLVQLEIGVQSTHTPTIREIRRTMDLPRLQNAFCHIQQAGNIHQHLDLIAGLPEEGFEDFAESFRQVYLWKPQQLQLGFLKVLKGSRIYGHREEYGLICQQYPPYEVLATKWISYDELLDIKLVEEMLEVYYNSAQFVLTMKVLELTCENPFFLYLELGRFYERQGLLAASHSRLRRAEILLEFARERDGQHLGLYQESLTFDLYSRENMKTRPSWSPAPASYKAETRRYCLKGKLSHLEPFCYDMEFLQESRTIAVYPSKLPEKQFWLFDYEDRNPLDRQAKAQKVQ